MIADAVPARAARNPATSCDHRQPLIAHQFMHPAKRQLAKLVQFAGIRLAVRMDAPVGHDPMRWTVGHHGEADRRHPALSHRSRDRTERPTVTDVRSCWRCRRHDCGYPRSPQPRIARRASACCCGEDGPPAHAARHISGPAANTPRRLTDLQPGGSSNRAPCNWYRQPGRHRRAARASDRSGAAAAPASGSARRRTPQPTPRDRAGNILGSSLVQRSG